MALRGGAQARHARREDGADRGAVRDRLRPLGAAPHRDVRRGRANLDGAPCFRGADRRRDQDQAAGLLRRHGWAAQGARQRAEPGAFARRAEQAVDQGAGPLRHARELWRTQQCDAARLPRSLRLRLRVRLRNRLLHLGPVRRGAAAHAAQRREGDGDHAADLPRGARGDLLAVPADPPCDRRRDAGAARCDRCRGRHDLLA